jgi:hypothetical protein
MAYTCVATLNYTGIRYELKPSPTSATAPPASTIQVENTNEVTSMLAAKGISLSLGQWVIVAATGNVTAASPLPKITITGLATIEEALAGDAPGVPSVPGTSKVPAFLGGCLVGAGATVAGTYLWKKYGR